MTTDRVMVDPQVFLVRRSKVLGTGSRSSGLTYMNYVCIDGYRLKMQFVILRCSVCGSVMVYVVKY